MDLNELRREIDEVDSKMVGLLSARMDITRKIASLKREEGLPVYDPEREREKLFALSAMAGDSLATETEVLFSTIFDLSRSEPAWS